MHLIFDFDGTLVNSYEVVCKHANTLAEEFRFRKISPDEFEQLKNLSMRELIDFLKIPKYAIPMLILRAKKMMLAELPALKPFDNLASALEALCQSGLELGILTSNSRENVAKWLDHYQLQQFFKFIHTETSLFGKKRVLNKIIRQHKMDKSEVYYIGDETRDIDAAKSSGIQSVAVTWGFNSRAILQNKGPDFIFDSPVELLSLLKVRK